jgi:hypothetical protein
MPYNFCFIKFSVKCTVDQGRFSGLGRPARLQSFSNIHSSVSNFIGPMVWISIEDAHTHTHTHKHTHTHTHTKHTHFEFYILD